MMNKMLATAAVAASAIALAGSGVSAASTADTPPKGARAVVEVSPNPTVSAGQAVTITGNCGGGDKLRAVLGGYNGKGVLENTRILNDDPNGFVAKANISENVTNGVGPVFVDCGTEAGVTLLVTHV